MKGKRYTTEEKIRMLRQADKGKTILEACRENNISEQSFHRWKREFGMIDVDQAKRMKELFEGERAVKTDAGGQDAGDRDPAGDARKKTVSPGTSGKWQRDLWLGASVRCERGAGTFGCTVAPMRIRRSIRMLG